MESVNISKIIRDVRVILDQNSEGYNVANVGEYTLELDDIILKSIVPAVQWAHMNAPLPKLKGKLFPVDAVLVGNRQKLPDDFMRLVSIRASSWKRAVSTYLTEDDPLVSPILSGYAGLMPTANKPAIVLRQEYGQQFLLLYPFDSEEDSSDDSSSSAVYIPDEVESAYYLPIPAIEADEESSSVGGDTIEIEEAVYEAVLYYIAHLVKMTYNEESKFAEQAAALL